MAKFHGFESSPAWTLDFFRIAKFEPFGVPKWLNLTVLNPPLPEPLNFSKSPNLSHLGWPNGWFFKITKFEPFGVWGAKVAKFSGFESIAWTIEFFEICKSAIWGAKVAKFNGFESSPAWTPEFFKITKFEPCGVRKWLNLTVLNPPLPELLNFSKSPNLSHLACQSG